MDRVSESPIDNTASNIVEKPSSGRTPQGRAQRQSFDFQTKSRPTPRLIDAGISDTSTSTASTKMPFWQRAPRMEPLSVDLKTL